MVRYSLLVLMGLTCLLAACAAPAQRPAETVRLKAVLLPFLTFAPYFIAQEEGFFAAQGLEIEFDKLTRSAEAIPAVAQGKLDVFGGAISFALLNAIGRGANIKIVADKAYFDPKGCTNSAVLVRRSLVESGEVTSLAQLRGRQVVFNPVGYQAYYMDKLLQPAGLSIDDLKAVNLADSEQLLALQEGAVDAVGTSEPWVTRIAHSGAAEVRWRVEEIIPDFQMAFVAYGPSLLEQNPDAGRRFMLAYLKGVRQYQQGKTERNLAILAKYTELDQETLKQACWPPFRADGSINAASLLDFQAWGLKRKALDALVPVEKFWDGRFVEYARTTLK